MPNFAKLFQDEVKRLARKEIRAAVANVQKGHADLRRTAADLRQRVTVLERENRRLTKAAAKAEPAQPDAPAEEQAERARISARTIRTLRAKLALSQGEFARLLGVSPQSVHQWEGREGRLNLRLATRKAVIEARSLGRKEARRRLDAEQAE